MYNFLFNELLNIVGPGKQTILLGCYSLLAICVVTMEIIVRWNQIILKRNKTSVSDILKKTGLFSAFISVVLIVHLIWKINSETDLQNFQLSKDFVTYIVVSILIPIHIIRSNENMKRYIYNLFPIIRFI